MSVLEFISSLKWPIVVLALLAVIVRGMKKNPGLANWIAAYVEKRDVRGKMGPAEFEATTPATSAIVQAAVASDDELASIAREQAPKADGTPAPAADVSTLRREVVEDLLRTSAWWGWEMAQIGFRTPPEPHVRWTDGRPEIRATPRTPLEKLDALRAPTVLTAEEVARRAAAAPKPEPSIEGKQAAIRRRLEEVRRDEDRG